MIENGALKEKVAYLEDTIKKIISKHISQNQNQNT